jgi:hypothetical protein
MINESGQNTSADNAQHYECRTPLAGADTSLAGSGIERNGNGPDGTDCSAVVSAKNIGAAHLEALARWFGWTESPDYPGSFDYPSVCPLRKSPDDNDDRPAPPPPDPAQLVLLADPTEDAALIRGGQVRELQSSSTETELFSSRRGGTG